MPGTRIVFIAPLVAIASGFGSVPVILGGDDIGICPCDSTNHLGEKILCGSLTNDLDYAEFRTCSQCYQPMIRALEGLPDTPFYREILEACREGEWNLYRFGCRDPKDADEDRRAVQEQIEFFSSFQLERQQCHSCPDEVQDCSGLPELCCTAVRNPPPQQADRLPTQGRDCVSFEADHIPIDTNDGGLTEGWCSWVDVGRIRADRAAGQWNGAELKCEDYYLFKDYAVSWPGVSIIDRALRCETPSNVNINALVNDPDVKNGKVFPCVGAGSSEDPAPNPLLVSHDCPLDDDVKQQIRGRRARE